MDYSPLLAVVTALIEIVAGIWTLRGPGRRHILRTSGVMLFLLAGYQIAEAVLCTLSPTSAVIPQLAFIIVTCLPPLGLILAAQLSSPEMRWMRITAFTMLSAGLAIIVWIAVDARFVSESVCDVVYARYTHPLPSIRFYGWYYWLGLFGIVLFSFLGRSRAEDPLQRRQLDLLLLGTLAFVVPGVVATRFIVPAEGALPSVLCHFALILALFVIALIRLERREGSNL